MAVDTSPLHSSLSSRGLPQVERADSNGSGRSFEGLPQVAHAGSDDSGLSIQELLKKQPDAAVIELGSFDEAEGSEAERGECERCEAKRGNAGAERKKIGWKRTTVLLIVEGIALGLLSMSAAFAAVGMLCGIILTVTLGLISIYTAQLIGRVKIMYPHVKDYPAAVKILGFKYGYEMCSFMYAGFLILLAGSHVLTGTIAINKLVARPEMCAVAWSVLAAVILFAFAIPKTFKDLTWFGYIDVLSVLSAVFIVIVAAAMGVRDPQLERDAVEWSWWPPADTSFDEIFLPVTNIIFAYSFSVCQYALMDEMHTPEDYMKSVWTLGLIEIVLYTVVGATLYVFVGSGVRELALLTGSPLISRIALGVALPVIFISGSINITVVAKYLVERCDSKTKPSLWNRSTHGLPG